MLITTPDMAVHRCSRQQQPISINDNIIQQEVRCSKLSKWLALDLEDQNPSLHPVSNLIQSSVIKPDILSSVFDSNTNTTENSISSDEHSCMRSERIDVQNGTTRQWNVNANPFRPVSVTSMHQNAQFLPNPTIPPIATTNTADFYNNMGMEQQIAANVDMFNTPGDGGLSNNNNIFTQAPPPRYPSILQQQQQPFQAQQQHQQFMNCFDMADNNMTWQDPNAEFRRWQQYTGTSTWGEPDVGKGHEPIQHWQQFTNDDCMEMIDHLDKINSMTFGTGIKNENNVGWGELPPIISGTYARIQHLQNSGDIATPSAPPSITNPHRGVRMPNVRLNQQNTNNNNIAFLPQFPNLNGGGTVGGGMERKPPVAVAYHHHQQQQPPPTPKWSNLDASFAGPHHLDGINNHQMVGTPSTASFNPNTKFIDNGYHFPMSLDQPQHSLQQLKMNNMGATNVAFPPPMFPPLGTNSALMKPIW